jgi:hypothetical protein
MMAEYERAMNDDLMGRAGAVKVPRHLICCGIAHQLRLRTFFGRQRESMTDIRFNGTHNLS